MVLKSAVQIEKTYFINNFIYIKPLLPVATQERIPLEPTSAARTIKKYLEIKKNVNYNKKGTKILKIFTIVHLTPNVSPSNESTVAHRPE